MYWGGGTSKLAAKYYEERQLISLKKRLISAQDFISYLNDTYGTADISPQAVSYVLDISENWEYQGLSKSMRSQDTASVLYERYLAYFEDIIAVSNISALKREKFYFALVCINNLNAYASTLPNNDKIVVLDENLITFLTTFIVAAIVGVYANAPAAELSEIEQFLLDNIKLYYISKQSSEKSKIYCKAVVSILKKDCRIAKLASSYSTAIVIFIICHELSHHILGHTAKGAIHTINLGGHQHKKTGHDEEFAADQYGYKLFLEYIERSNSIEFSKLCQMFKRVPLLFFEIIYVTELLAKQYGDVKFVAGSHPCSLERKRRLLDSYGNTLGSEKDGFFECLIKFINGIVRFI